MKNQSSDHSLYPSPQPDRMRKDGRNSSHSFLYQILKNQATCSSVSGRLTPFPIERVGGEVAVGTPSLCCVPSPLVTLQGRVENVCEAAPGLSQGGTNAR